MLCVSTSKSEPFVFDDVCFLESHLLDAALDNVYRDLQLRKCSVDSCRRIERLMKGRIHKIPAQEKLECLYSLLSSVLPVIKKIHNQQTCEADLEKRLYGSDVNLARTKLSADEQMCWTPIIDYYRNCGHCSYDLCLNCCKDLRKVSATKGQDREGIGEALIKTNIFIGVEPWSFEQHVGQAVFVPAGCPFQLRNLESTVQLSLDFLSPESLGETETMAEEIRCLPDDHDAKLKMLEVGKDISIFCKLCYKGSSEVGSRPKIQLLYWT